MKSKFVAKMTDEGTNIPTGDFTHPLVMRTTKDKIAKLGAVINRRVDVEFGSDQVYIQFDKFPDWKTGNGIFDTKKILGEIIREISQVLGFDCKYKIVYSSRQIIITQRVVKDVVTMDEARNMRSLLDTFIKSTCNDMYGMFWVVGACVSEFPADLHPGMQIGEIDNTIFTTDVYLVLGDSEDGSRTYWLNQIIDVVYRELGLRISPSAIRRNHKFWHPVTWG